MRKLVLSLLTLLRKKGEENSYKMKSLRLYSSAPQPGNYTRSPSSAWYKTDALASGSRAIPALKLPLSAAAGEEGVEERRITDSPIIHFEMKKQNTMSSFDEMRSVSDKKKIDKLQHQLQHTKRLSEEIFETRKLNSQLKKQLIETMQRNAVLQEKMINMKVNVEAIRRSSIVTVNSEALSPPPPGAGEGDENDAMSIISSDSDATVEAAMNSVLRQVSVGTGAPRRISPRDEIIMNFVANNAISSKQIFKSTTADRNGSARNSGGSAAGERRRENSGGSQYKSRGGGDESNRSIDTTSAVTATTMAPAADRSATKRRDSLTRNVSEMILKSIGSSSSSLPLLSTLGGNNNWLPNNATNECMVCSVRFTLFLRRKHHCRLCGFVVCNDCSTGRRKLNIGFSRCAERVCDACCDSLDRKSRGVLSESRSRLNKSINDVVSDIIQFWKESNLEEMGVDVHRYRQIIETLLREQVEKLEVERAYY